MSTSIRAWDHTWSGMKGHIDKAVAARRRFELGASPDLWSDM